MSNLDEVIDLSERWAVENAMTINKKKSKIMLVGGQMKYDIWERTINKEYRGYGLCLSYKSLGVVIQRDGLFN